MEQSSILKFKICQSSVPRQTFYSQCGARLWSDYMYKKESLLARLKYSLEKLFWSETRKEAERHLNAGFDIARFGFEAAVPEHERAASLNPKFKSILATTYAAAGRVS